MLTSELVYELPEAAIAQTPIEPRDASRLLLTRDGSDHRFADLPDLLEPGDILVFNDTRVRAARLLGTRRPGGGAAEVLLLNSLGEGRWTALLRPARRLPPGTEIDVLGLTVTVLSAPVDGEAEVQVDGADDQEAAVAKRGQMPLPPYITTNLQDPERYQTVYADRVGSAAAPTAGLHFTPELLQRLERSGIRHARIELRVGPGTFRPITAERVEDHRMHPEWVSVPVETAAAIDHARERGSNVVAIGTTVVRALESRAGTDGRVEPGEGRTSLFIRPGFSFRVVDRLVTNFHLPASSLICLVAAFMGEGWRDTYEKALARGYRFLSFGDAMLADRRSNP